MSARPVAWVLNLDAENELETEGSYTPSRHMQAIVQRESRRLLHTLVAPGDVVLSGEENRDAGAHGLPGLCWSPTRSAIAQLERAGVQPVATPDVGILREVNARPFAARVRATLADNDAFAKQLATSLEQALELLSVTADHASEGWLVRRSFGASGRGRRHIAAGSPTAAELSWLEKSLRTGPLILEPWVDITREFTRSGWVGHTGHVHAAAPCFQATTREGAWAKTAAADADGLSQAEDRELEAAFFAAGKALGEHGYHGPFGIDSFRYRTAGPGTPEVLNALSEINARFTMDWTTGMGQDPGATLASAREALL